MDAAQPAHDRIKEPIVKWFQAVKQVKDSAATHLGPSHAANITFQRAWDLARVHYPKEYAAAHGLVSETPVADDPSDVLLAGQQLTEVTNRISILSGCDLSAAYRFAQQHLPALCNRLTPQSQRIVNRNPSGLAMKDAAKAAARIINRLIQADQVQTGWTYSVVYSKVMNREPLLADLASGRISPGKVFTEHPGLWERLAMESEGI